MCALDFYIFIHICFVHPIFRFWSLLTTILRKYYVIFVYNFSRQDRQDGKKWKENHATKVTKIPKEENMG